MVGLGIAASGCALSSSKQAVVKECVLPEDQTGTLAGKWSTTPIPIALKSGQFNGVETTEIVAAAKTWNDFYFSSLGIQVLDYGSESQPNTSTASKPTSLCSQGIVAGGKFTGKVVIHKQTTWPYNNHDAIALTSFCPVASSPLPLFYMAIMELNYQDFFVDGKKLPDLTSILIHELGHLVGLDHSCDTQGKNGFPDCSSSGLSNDYFEAVMFPIILFDSTGYGEKRQALKKNDQGRANCLYQ